jgi:hypothetical protein
VSGIIILQKRLVMMMTCRGITAVAGVLMVALSNICFAITGPGLSIEAGGNAYSDCRQGEQHLAVANSTGLIRVFISSPPDEVRGLTLMPCGKLIIQAGTRNDDDLEIVPGLAQHMGISPFVMDPLVGYPYFMNAEAIQSWQSTNSKVGGSVVGRSWNFEFVIPPDLTGKEVFFSALYVTPNGDTLLSGEPSLLCPPECPDPSHINYSLRVIEPCSDDDNDRALGTRVVTAWREGQHAKAIALADSLLETGWCDMAGIEAAMLAANRMGLQERSDYYRDLNMQAHGTTTTLVGMRY